MDTKKYGKKSSIKRNYKRSGLRQKTAACFVTVFFIFSGIPVPTSFAIVRPVAGDDRQQLVPVVVYDPATSNIPAKNPPAPVPSGVAIQNTNPLSSNSEGLPRDGNPAPAAKVLQEAKIAVPAVVLSPVPDGWTRTAYDPDLAYRGDNTSGVEVMNLGTGAVATAPSSQNVTWSTGGRVGIRYVITSEGLKELYFTSQRSNTSVGVYDPSLGAWFSEFNYVPGFFNNGNDLKVSADGQYAVIAHQANNITVLSLSGSLTSSRVFLPAAAGYGIPWVGTIIFSGERTAVISVDDGSNRQFDLEIKADGTAVLYPHVPTGWTRTAYDPNLAYRGDNTSGVEVMDLSTGAVATAPSSQNVTWSTGARSGIRYVITPEGLKELYFTSQRSNTSVGVYDPSLGAWFSEFNYVPGFFNNGNDLKVSPDGQYAVIAHQANNITVLSLSGSLTSSRVFLPAAAGYGIPWAGTITFTGERTAVISVNDGSNRQFDLEIKADGTAVLYPHVPAGWTRAGSNPNYAFQVQTVGKNQTLVVKDLLTGKNVVIATVHSPRKIGDKYDIAPDGKTVVYSIAGPRGYPGMTVVQSMMKPSKKVSLPGAGTSIQFISGYWVLTILNGWIVKVDPVTLKIIPQK